ncbi:MAG TPA: alanine/ornithine racemase family PLP-dependent enzyme [Bacteroidales bacterium]|nr:alanine/ornithine racemase family PLP-dependent enzyme [Bacteroidales bacterium]
MASIVLDSKKLRANFNYLDKLFAKHDIKWSVVSKMLCGNRLFIRELIRLGITQVCDSRVSNLRAIKTLAPEIETIYIKPPPKTQISAVVRYADISFNTEYETIRMLSKEATNQGKVHKIIIMIELGELREGVMRDDVVDFYAGVFELPSIEVVGIGTNLSCLYGVLPNHDKLIQLSLYKQLIEVKFNKKIPYVSGGSSVTIPLIDQKLLPTGINHFRVGETLYLGTDVYNNTTYKKMHRDVFTLYAEIIELIEKPLVPMGEMGTNVEGQSFDFPDGEIGKTSYRAILDIGLLDVEETHIEPADPTQRFVGASSDMLVVDLGQNKKNYKVGDTLKFQLDYLGTLRIINSRYIEKKVI